MGGGPERGLFEALITEALDDELKAMDGRLHVKRSELRPAEAADRISLHLARVIERAIAGISSEKERVQTGIRIARELLDRLDELLESTDAAPDRPIDPGEVLVAILGRRPDGSPSPLGQPLIPLLDTTLLTNAPGEPRVGSQLPTEVISADRIDVVMAFIRRTGLPPALVEPLRRHVDEGRPLRVLTTTYTGSTERAALDRLAELGAQIRVSYDTTTTRLHAKAWLFHRHSGFSTAYIGSSNLTHSAQVSGLEWNVRVSGARNPDVIAKMTAVFDAYWESGDFAPYEPDEFDRNVRRSTSPGPQILLGPELRAEPFQAQLLEQLELARVRGHHRNLLVSATGTGKTVMAAIDYVALRRKLPRARLLFVAHRQEILDQSQATFRYALRDPSFGERWVGGERPDRFEHVFASIQSLNARGLADLAADHFDVVIIDEFHHAAAPSYRALLDHVQPRELLGLTATPERSDGLPILDWFDGRIAAELRLWDAIDQHRLAPFAYFGIHDGLDLRDVPWKRGGGYDVEGLTNLYTASDVWARQVVSELARHVDDVADARVLGFCVSVEHARYMARVFNDAGIRAVAVWADTRDDERRAALAGLSDGRISVVFAVDLFNEGVDVPAVDTLLLLRPTDSPTLFLQQLGRGLRRSDGKALCTVLDFVGMHRKEFRLDRRLRALLGGTRRGLEAQIKEGFPFLPAGCHLELDAVAAREVLRSLKESVPSRWPQKVEELRLLVGTGAEPSLAGYLHETGLDLDDLYFDGRSWSDLLEAAGAPTKPIGPAEPKLRKAIGRLLHLDDFERIGSYERFLASATPPAVDELYERDRRLVRMLVAGLARQAVNKDTSLQDGVDLLWRHPQVLAELEELLPVLSAAMTHVPLAPLDHPEVPLRVHSRYTRDEIMAAFGIGSGARVAPWQTGVYWAEKARADLLAFTLDKTGTGFSPTTRYRDYAISRNLIHWESQSATRADSRTGRRYQQHVELGTSVHLFARLHQRQRAFWYLGTASYVSHQGERPMAITWRLTHALPGDLFAQFAAAVA